MAKCKNCINFDRAITSDNEYICNWCEKIKDNPHEEIERECEHYVIMTNADRIRSMTDEELAKVIMCPYERDYRDCKEGCWECCFKWLKAEVGCE